MAKQRELEAALELRWADIAHLDTKLADALDRERVLREALKQIERYATDDHVKRCARAALSAHKKETAP